jgi:hypothetical protein
MELGLSTKILGVTAGGPYPFRRMLIYLLLRVGFRYSGAEPG